MTDALAGTGFAVDQGEAALTQVRLFDAPAEVLDFGRHIERLGRHLRGEGVPFQAVQGQQLLVHTQSSFSVVNRRAVSRWRRNRRSFFSGSGAMPVAGIALVSIGSTRRRNASALAVIERAHRAEDLT